MVGFALAGEIVRASTAFGFELETRSRPAIGFDLERRKQCRWVRVGTSSKGHRVPMGNPRFGGMCKLLGSCWSVGRDVVGFVLELRRKVNGLVLDQARQ